MNKEKELTNFVKTMLNPDIFKYTIDDWGISIVKPTTLNLSWGDLTADTTYGAKLKFMHHIIRIDDYSSPNSYAKDYSNK
jgi:hypothetical protein